MIQQVEFALAAKHRGCHLVTREIIDRLPKPLPKAGLLNLFIKHTSCALSINENADPDVRSDMEKIMNHIVRENEPYYDHVLEGADDMPAHAKSSLFGGSLVLLLLLLSFRLIVRKEVELHGGILLLSLGLGLRDDVVDGDVQPTDQ